MFALTGLRCDCRPAPVFDLGLVGWCAGTGWLVGLVGDVPDRPGEIFGQTQILPRDFAYNRGRRDGGVEEWGWGDETNPFLR